jgi:hypothetical protein
MSLKNYSATSLTGGGAGALDAIDGTDLQNLDFAAVFTIDTFYFYVLDVDAGGAESSPAKIAPDANAGNKRWILLYAVGTGGLKLLDSNATHVLTLVPGSNLTAAKTVTIYTGDSNRSLYLTSDNMFLESDGTAGRVLRHARLLIKDATAATEINCEVSPGWNGDTIAETDNIGKNETVGNFSLSADGTTITIEAAGLTGNAVGVLAYGITRNQSQTDLSCYAYLDAGEGTDIVVQFYDTATGAGADTTTLVDTGQVDVYITYITSA